MRKRDDDAAPPAVMPGAERARQPDDDRLRRGRPTVREADEAETDAAEPHLHQPPARRPLLRTAGVGVDDGAAEPHGLADDTHL